MAEKVVRDPWTFSAPKYDDRNKQIAGFVHGVGKTQPVGHEGNPKASSVIPKECKHEKL
jgi:hypothetical protein